MVYEGTKIWTTKYFPLLCFIFEFTALIFALLEHGNNCIQTQSISNRSHFFLLFLYPWIIPDLLFFALSFHSDTICIRPYGEMFHIVASSFSLTGSVILLSGVPLCYEKSRTNFVLAGATAFFAAILHVVEAKCINKLFNLNKKMLAGSSDA